MEQQRLPNGCDIRQRKFAELACVQQVPIACCWWVRQESDLLHLDFQSNALPVELLTRSMCPYIGYKDASFSTYTWQASYKRHDRLPHLAGMTLCVVGG